MIYFNFFENTEKVKPTQISTSIISDFYVSLYYWKERTASQNEDCLIPRHGNVKKPSAAYYRTDSQTIIKARTTLSENYNSSPIYNP